MTTTTPGSQTPLVTFRPAKEETKMDDEKNKPLVDQMTDVVADGAGELAKTAVKAAAKRAKKAVVDNTPRPSSEDRARQNPGQRRPRHSDLAARGCRDCCLGAKDRMAPA